MKAANDGDAEEASYLFRLHSTMVIPTQASQAITVDIQRPKANTTDRVVTKIDLTKEEAIEDEAPFVENGITFMPGEYYFI